MDNIDVTKKINSLVRLPQLIIDMSFSSAPGIIVNVSSLFSTLTIVSDITFRNNTFNIVIMVWMLIPVQLCICRLQCPPHPDPPPPAWTRSLSPAPPRQYWTCVSAELWGRLCVIHGWPVLALASTHQQRSDDLGLPCTPPPASQPLDQDDCLLCKHSLQQHHSGQARSLWKLCELWLTLVCVLMKIYMTMN